jgi:hypothetical protein
MKMDEKIIEAKNQFYKWEDKKFPEGNSPYSDDDIAVWVLGYLEGQSLMNPDRE